NHKEHNIMAEAIIRPLEAAKRCGISRSLLFALRAKGDFPQPIRITSRTIGFREADVDTWIRQRIAATCSDAEKPKKVGAK
ncbi:MAG: AlpA family phage regulatory protein, partial [Dehalococcoidia bacterium]